MREIRTLRSMWRGLETWRGREASRPKPARLSSTLPTRRGLETWHGQDTMTEPARQSSTLPERGPGCNSPGLLACLVSAGSTSRHYSLKALDPSAAAIIRRSGRCAVPHRSLNSGKSRIVVMRYAAHVRLRNTVYHWARVAIQHDPKSHRRYVALRQRGHSHGRALRGVADRLLDLACVLLQRQTPFDPQFGQSAT